MDSKLRAVLAQTLTLTTAAPTQAAVAPRGASGIEISGTGAPTFGLTPRLAGAFLFDDSAGSYTDLGPTLRERGTTNLAILDAFEGGADFLYLGADTPFRGVYVLVANGNVTSSVATVKYWDGSAWSDISDTDNTSSAGATLAISDTITWTVPTDWTPTTVSTVGPEMFWVRYEAATTLDAEVELTNVVPLTMTTSQPVATVQTASTTGAMLPRFWFAEQEIGGVEVTGDNTDTAIINWLITKRVTSLVVDL